MPKPKKRKRKGRIRVRQSVAIVPKDSIRHDSINGDTLPRMQAQPPRTVAPVLKVKIRKKNGN